MSSNQLRAPLRARPFRPFRVWFSDGGAYNVWHPETAAVAEGRFVIHLLRSEERVETTEAVASLLHVTRYEYLPRRRP